MRTSCGTLPSGECPRRGRPTAGSCAGAGRRRSTGGWNSKTLRQVLTHPRTSGHVVYQGQIIRRGAYKPILQEDIRQALITLLSDPSRKTSPGNTTKWLGSLIYRCGVCGDGTTMTVRRNTTGTPVYRCRARGHCSWPADRLDAHVANVLVERLSRADVADLIPAPAGGGRGRAARGAGGAGGPQEAARRSCSRAARSTGSSWRRSPRPPTPTDRPASARPEGRHRQEPAGRLRRRPTTPAAPGTGCRIGRRRGDRCASCFTVTLPPLGRGHTFNRDLIRISGATAPARAA